MIITENLTKTYKNGFTAVKDLSLNVSQGDIFGYLGPNGAGKTTTIRMLTGLLKPTQGKVFINKFNVQENTMEVKKIIGVVPESHGYYYWMTSKEYLTYFSRIFHMDREKSNKYVKYLLNRVGLYGKMDVPIGQYSRGMKQRLGIAKSLINNPKIIFLDEPTLGLDPIGQKEIQNLILEINKTENITVFITSHMLKDIETLCNKVCIVQNGKLIEQGSIKELQTKFVDEEVVKVKTSNNEMAVNLLKNNRLIDKVDILDEYIYISLKQNQRETKVDGLKNGMVNSILQILFNNEINIIEFTKQELGMEDIFFKAIKPKVNGRNDK